MFHYAYPKYLAMPDSQEMSGNLWFLFINGSAPGELERYISNRLSNDTCISVLLKDHTYDTLNEIRERIRSFVDGARNPRSGTSAR